jgi:hypothetical protein
MALDGKATIVLSHSERFREEVAKPVAQRLQQFGFRTILVGEEPLPSDIASSPDRKVDWYFRRADMAVFLATPDDQLTSGDVQTRQNIIDEHRLGLELDQLSDRLLVFKSKSVVLPSNINPAYERLPLDDPDWIVAKIVDQARTWRLLPHDEEEGIERAPESSEAGKVPKPPPGDDDAVATEQAQGAINGVREALEGSDPHQQTLERAELAIAGLTATNGGAETLGVHLANSLFSRRDDLRLTRSERLLLIRTYLRNVRDDNVPGVFWLRDLPKRQVVELLSAIVREDADITVLGEALVLLAKLKMPRSTDDAAGLLHPLLASSDSSRREHALDYIRIRGDSRLRRLLDDPQLLERDRDRVSKTAALLDVARRPSDVMDRYVGDAYVRSPELEERLLANASRVRRDEVLKALESSVEEVRLFGARMASTKGMLSLDVGRARIGRDRSARVRMAVLRLMFDAGLSVGLEDLEHAFAKRDDDITGISNFDERHTLETKMCLRLSDVALRAGVRWASARGDAYYEALGLRDAEWAATHVRRDLLHDFADLKAAGEAEIIADTTLSVVGATGRPPTEQERAAIKEAVATSWHQWVAEDELGGFLTRRFQRAALRVLVARGTPRDVKFARQFATSTDDDLRVESIYLLDRFGTSHDSTMAAQLAEQVYGEDHRVNAAEIALRLAFKKNKLSILARLRETPGLADWSTSRLADVDHGIQEAIPLLTSKDSRVRLAAARIVWDWVSPDRAAALLTLYMTHGEHFYNVVREIDRRLYAPEWLRASLPVAD